MTAYISRVLGTLLEQLYNVLAIAFSEPTSYALSIILFTVFVKVILIPLSVNSQKSMLNMQKIQPEMNAIQERLKKAKTKEEQAVINAEMTGLYKKHKVNPLGGCLPLLIQFPILIGLYQVFMNASKNTPGIPKEALEGQFLWLPKLAIYGVTEARPTVEALQAARDPYFILPILVGVTMFLSTKITQKLTPQQKNDSNPQAAQMTQTMNTMNMVFPFLMAWLTYQSPAGLGIYFLVGNVFQIFQTYLVNRIVQREQVKGA